MLNRVNQPDSEARPTGRAEGKSVLVVPARFFRFGPAGGSLECNIFTRGKGTLSITGSELPRGFVVSLGASGSLAISVGSLPDGEGVRSGVVELGFGGLSEDIIVLQSPGDEALRRVNPASLSSFAATGAVGMGGAIEVSASDPWKAQIYNFSNDEANPGFRFVGGSDPYVWDSERDGNLPFDIATTGDNPGVEPRRGIAIFSLKKHPEYRRTLMLCQDPGL